MILTFILASAFFYISFYVYPDRFHVWFVYHYQSIPSLRNFLYTSPD